VGSTPVGASKFSPARPPLQTARKEAWRWPTETERPTTKVPQLRIDQRLCWSLAEDAGFEPEGLSTPTRFPRPTATVRDRSSEVFALLRASQRSPTHLLVSG
jgi:hypothetical protein